MRVFITQTAQKQLKKLPVKLQKKMEKVIKLLINNQNTLLFTFAKKQTQINMKDV